jgi:hypothetical protein
LKGLRSLHVRTFERSVLVSGCEDGEEEVVVESGKEVCEKVLREKLPWCGKVIVCVRKDGEKGHKGCEMCQG